MSKTEMPSIRFYGFDDAWEQRKLGDNIAEYTEKTTINNQYPVLTSSRRGIFFQTDYYDGNQIASADNTGYNIVPYGYFTYRHMSDDEIFHFNINDITENGIVSTLYPVFTTDENLDSRYLQYQLNYGKEFAKYWMHNGFLNIDNKKMSKSLGNFFTVREIGEKYDLQILRFFMLSAHYRSPLNFSAELMEAAKNSLERILTAADNLKFLISNTSEEKMTESEKRLFEKSSEYVEAFERAMDDDFNTADAIAAIFDLVKYMNTTADGASSKEYLQNLLDRLCLLTDVLGIIVIKEEEMLDSEIEEMIEKRQAARKDRNFALADQIRDELLAKGIILEDTREGVKWKKA